MAAAVRLRACIAAVVALASAAGTPALGQSEGVRALWVVRTTLTSPASIDAMVEAARAGGFNTLLVQVRGRGDAYYLHGSEPRADPLSTEAASFDPLGQVITRARAAGLRVHAWVNTNLVSNVAELPGSRDHVIYRHPEWLMVPREMVEPLAGLEPSDPAYLRRLVDYVRSRPGDLEGLYLSPVPSESAAYTIRVIADIVRRYPVDGIHLDYVRYPAEDFDHGRLALAGFRRAIADRLTVEERRHYEARAAQDHLAYVDAFPVEWTAFRRNRLTALVAGIRQAVKKTRSDVVLSAAVFPDPIDAFDHRFQDWPAWVDRGLLDVVCPMVYTTDTARFAEQVTTAGRLVDRRVVWTGIGAYRLSEEQIATNVRTARQAGVGGVVLFSYDSLAAGAQGPSYVADLGRSLFAP